MNVGCGGDIWGEVRVDIVKTVKPTVVADAHNLPFVDCSFDVTKASHVLEHLDNPLKALDEIMRVTRKVVLLIFPTKEGETALFFFNFPTAYRLRRDHAHKWIIDPKIVITHLKKNGWQIRDFKEDKMPFFFFLTGGRKAKYFKWLTNFNLKAPLSWQCIILAVRT